MDHLIDLKQSFKEYSERDQINVLYTYACYVANFWNDHEDTDKPVSFWEWFENDYPESKIVEL